MQLSFFKKMFVGIVLTSASASAFGEASDIRDRLNKIFYWQVADELKLSPKIEKEMISIIEEVQNKREAALQERDRSLFELRKFEKKLQGKVAKEVEVTQVLDRYQNALSVLAGLDLEEHARLKEVLGVESLAHFYLVRDSITTKIRDAIKTTGPKNH